jgi:hypothetical protein
VVVDTFGRAVAGEEDRADTVRAFYRYTGARLKRLGVGYLRTDHAGKEVGRGQRGSSAKRDDVDIVWQASRTKAGVMLSCANASRLSWVGPSLVLDRIETDLGTIAYRQRHDVMVIDDTTRDKVEELERLAIPLGWGRKRVLARYAEEGIEPGRWSILSAAIKARKTGSRGVPESVPEGFEGTP